MLCSFNIGLPPFSLIDTLALLPTGLTHTKHTPLLSIICKHINSKSTVLKAGNFDISG